MAIKFSTKDQSKPGSAVKETAAETATRERVKAAGKAASGTAAAPVKPVVDLFEDESEGTSKPPRGKKK